MTGILLARNGVSSDVLSEEFIKLNQKVSMLGDIDDVILEASCSIKRSKSVR